MNRNWSAKAEYDYLNFGTQNVVLTDTTRVNLKQDFNQVKIGLNYRFGPSDDEVVAAPAMPLKAKAAPAVAFNWTGGYIGAAAADRWSDASGNTTAIGNGPEAIPPLSSTPNPTSSSVSSSAPRCRVAFMVVITGSSRGSGWPALKPGTRALVIAGCRAAVLPGPMVTAPTRSSWVLPSLASKQSNIDFTGMKLGCDASIRGRLGMLVSALCPLLRHGRRCLPARLNFSVVRRSP